MTNPAFGNIPDQLKEYDHWVVWRKEARDGKTTKIPYQPLVERPLLRAKSTDPNTWGSFEEARAVYNRGDDLDGIGFVFSDDDPFCGIDLDGVIDPEQGNITDDLARDIVAQMNSYTEYSPSETGLHIIVEAVKPEKGFRKGIVEMYDRERFFTITGNRASSMATINKKQRQLLTLHASLFPPQPPPPPQPTVEELSLEDEEIVRIMERSASGTKFTALYYHGDISIYDGDESRADQGLLGMMAFYTRDAHQLERLFNASALGKRGKWRDRAKYRSDTIAKAISGQTGHYSGSSAKKIPPKPAPVSYRSDASDASPQVPSFAQNGNGRASDASGASDASASGARVTTIARAKPTRKEQLKNRPMPFPVEAMPARCQRLITEGAKALMCPPEFIAFPMLAALSSAVGTTRRLDINRSWREYPGLFLTIVAYPGSMKSPAAKIANKPVYALQRQYEAEHIKKRDEYQRELREYEVEKAQARKDGEAAPPPPEEPVMQRTVAGDTTVEALAPILVANPRGVYVHRDELAGWVRSMDQYRSGGKGADTELWLSVWGNEAWVIDRKGKTDPVFISNPFVTLFGGMTPLRLGELGNPMEDGLMERFLFGYPDASSYRYTRVGTSVEAEGAYANLYNTLAKLQPEEGEAKVLELTQDADLAFEQVVNTLAEESEQPGFPRKLYSVWAKLRGYAGRLSLLLAVSRIATREATAGPGQPGAPEQAVTDEDVLKASRLLDYFKSHAKRVFDAAQDAHPDDLFVADVADFLEEHHNGTWTGQASNLLSALQEHGCEALPDQPKGLSQKLQKVANQDQGIHFDSRKDKTGKTRILTVSTSEIGITPKDASDASLRPKTVQNSDASHPEDASDASDASESSDASDASPHLASENESEGNIATDSGDPEQGGHD